MSVTQFFSMHMYTANTLIEHTLTSRMYSISVLEEKPYEVFLPGLIFIKKVHIKIANIFSETLRECTVF